MGFGSTILRDERTARRSQSRLLPSQCRLTKCATHRNVRCKLATVFTSRCSHSPKVPWSPDSSTAAKPSTVILTRLACLPNPVGESSPCWSRTWEYRAWRALCHRRAPNNPLNCSSSDAERSSHGVDAAALFEFT